MSARDLSLDDKYTLDRGRVFLSGTQAIVRLPMLQRLRDEAAGLNTGGFISGYRGSPLGGVDLNLWRAKAHLARHHITFQPGVNEDLAATAVWGSQQVGLFPGARYDGVFGLWYGKGPGVDRSGDVFRHANAAGTSRFGGVLAIAGDDHGAKSSTLPHQTEHVFKAVMMPVLAPANVQEYLDYGLHGWAMSRYSGCWVAFKALADTVETSASVNVDPLGLEIRIPDDFEMPEGGLNIRWPDPPLVQEARLLHHKLYAALAYCRANRLNRVVIDSPNPRLGIITTGKSYLDVRQAFDELGIDDALAARIGIRLFKVGMVWPLEAEGVRHFAEGLEEILVVEEKRQLLEYQLKEELYNWREDVRPRVIGKFDEKGEWAMIPRPGADGHTIVDHGEWLLPAAGELTITRISRVIAARIQRHFTSPEIEARLALLERKEDSRTQPLTLATRTPTFCSGCPHNTSTRVPEGSRAVAGIGCHYMVTWMGRNTSTFTHMGGEGVPWVGQAPFTDEKHLFANLGDGTYYHSGLLAIRQSIAAGVNITYKILFNDAVAMTGGQPVDGPLTVPRITRQLEAEGVRETVVVTDEPEKYASVRDLAAGVRVHHRDELDAIQRRLRDIPGTTILIYDQTCATEKRRRRKRGKLPDPARRAFINTRVCEGCGDCSRESNCLSVIPVDTEYGRKRAIDQSACNKDFSCLKGLCPSFVTIEGGRLRTGAGLAAEVSPDHLPPPPEPTIPATGTPFNVLVTGVGGTGVVTLGALLGTAAHIDGKGVSVLDMTGLAQKYGAVYSHIRFADRPEDLHAVRVATGDADALIGGDLVVSGSPEALSKLLAGRTRAVINLNEAPTADFTRNPDWRLPTARLRQQIAATVGDDRAEFVDATALATALMGDAVFANLFLLGFAWQRGLLPVSGAALDRAIELNGVAVDRNRLAFRWGRLAACDLTAVQRLVHGNAPTAAAPDTLDALIARRSEELVRYQDRRYATRYAALVARVRSAEAPLQREKLTLTRAVAENLYRLMAIKDEYEVARLLASAEFHADIAAHFEGDYRIRYHLAPPRWAKPDPHSGRPRKTQWGGWARGLFSLLQRLRGLRGTAFDLFGQTAERRFERQLLAEYEADIAELLPRLDAGTHAQAVELARLPEQIRGFGAVKLQAADAVAKRRNELRDRLFRPSPRPSADRRAA